MLRITWQDRLIGWLIARGWLRLAAAAGRRYWVSGSIDLDGSPAEGG